MHKSIKMLAVFITAILFFQVPSFANSKVSDQRNFIVTNLPQGCIDVSYGNGYAYAAVGDSGLSIYDIKQPGVTNRLGSISLQEYVEYVAVSGDNVYLMADDGLFVVSVSSPERPVCLFKHRIYAGESCCGMGADDENLYLLYSEHLDVYSLENPLCPNLKVTYKTGQVLEKGNFTGMAVSNGIVYMTHTDEGIAIFDFTNKENIKFLGNFQATNDAYNSVDIYGNLALARAYDKKALAVFDISDIRNPGFIGVVSDLSPDILYYVGIDEKIEAIVTPTPTPTPTPTTLHTIPGVTPYTGKSSKDKVAYLTIDDGPSRNITPGNLDTLKKYGVKATFFVLPRSNVDDIYKRIINEGHVIGNHSYSHDYNYLLQTTDNFKGDVLKARNFIYNKLNYTTTVFRFPGGKMGYNSKDTKDRTTILTELGYSYFGWDVSTADTDPNLSKYGTTDQIVNILVNNVLKGAKGRNKPIILMHDSSGKKYSAKALPKIIEGLDKMGYSFDVLTNY